MSVGIWKEITIFDWYTSFIWLNGICIATYFCCDLAKCADIGRQIGILQDEVPFADNGAMKILYALLIWRSYHASQVASFVSTSRHMCLVVSLYETIRMQKLHEAMTMKGKGLVMMETPFSGWRLIYHMELGSMPWSWQTCTCWVRCVFGEERS